MKNLNVVTILVVAFFLVIMESNATNSVNGFNEYEITSVNDLHMGENVQAIWTVSYSDTEVPVTVVKRKTTDGIAYVVQNKYFSVCYSLNDKGFGAKEVKKAWTSVPRQINDVVINKEALALQKIITPNQVNDANALELIANYLPELINENYSHLLN